MVNNAVTSRRLQECLPDMANSQNCEILYFWLNEGWYAKKSSSFYPKISTFLYIRVMASSGSSMPTVNQLNMSWTVAPANARRKSFLDTICPMETMVLVTEVPILAPMTIGIPTRTDITENTINGVGDGGPYIGPHDDRYPDSHWYYWKYNKWCCWRRSLYWPPWR